MKNQTVISVQNLSKSYRLGAIGSRTISADLNRWWARLRKQPDPYLVIGQEHLADRMGERIWALKDINFEVQQGQALGIIGRNGAGKSTLLKILSRVTAPTTGEIRVKGRIASLLEVGTGFQPELTGRENIFLNGAIMGMKRPEIERKFEEIVSFASLEKFIDTPVKRYSSGMYVRLAFAVAAHLDPEILIVDEVLAVGDAEFQKKCLGKMGDTAQSGKTVLFVSHNMGAIESLCKQTMLLDRGNLIFTGDTKKAIQRYLSEYEENTYQSLHNCPRKGNGKLMVTSLHMETIKGQKVSDATSGNPIVLVFGFKNVDCSKNDRLSFSFSIHDKKELGLFHSYSHFQEMYFRNLPEEGFIRCLIPEVNLSPGEYKLMIRVVMNGTERLGEEVDWPQIYLPMSVTPGDFYRTGNVNLSTWGPILVRTEWTLQE